VYAKEKKKIKSQGECKTVCPTKFSPLVEFPDGNEILAMRGQAKARLTVSIMANPAPSVT
jgi:hypothetical protein